MGSPQASKGVGHLVFAFRAFMRGRSYGYGLIILEFASVLGFQYNVTACKRHRLNMLPPPLVLSALESNSVAIMFALRK
jgi:hypothetical protein